jgi:Fe2+ transport system protein FeoA
VQNVVKKTNNIQTSKADCEVPENCPIQKVAQHLKKSGALTLDQLLPGDTGIVKTLSKARPRLCCKLQAMGIVEGQRISVKQRAPFGDPISISTLGYTLSLRLCEAQAIEIEAI